MDRASKAVSISVAGLRHPSSGDGQGRWKRVSGKAARAENDGQRTPPGAVRLCCYLLSSRETGKCNDPARQSPRKARVRTLKKANTSETEKKTTRANAGLSDPVALLLRQASCGLLFCDRSRHQRGKPPNPGWESLPRTTQYYDAVPHQAPPPTRVRRGRRGCQIPSSSFGDPPSSTGHTTGRAQGKGSLASHIDPQCTPLASEARDGSSVPTPERSGRAAGAWCGRSSHRTCWSTMRDWQAGRQANLRDLTAARVRPLPFPKDSCSHRVGSRAGGSSPATCRFVLVSNCLTC